MSDHDFPAAFDLASGIRVIHSPYLPKGVALFLRGEGEPISQASLSIRPDPWAYGEPFGFTPEAKMARRQALGHLEGLLDGLCRKWGMDPDKTWREPRQAEILSRTQHYQLRAEQLVGLMLNDPRNYLKVAYTS